MKALATTLIWTGVALALPGLILSGIGFNLEALTQLRRPA